MRGGGGVPSALCCRQRWAAVAAAGMGGYELVRSDDSAGAAPGPDLESGAGAAASKAAPPSPASRQPRLVSLDVFRGITVLVRTHPHCTRCVLNSSSGLDSRF